MAFNNNNTATGTTGTTGAPGATGAHGTAGATHEPTFGDKVSGTFDKLAGKITNNPAKVAEGEAKKHGDVAGAQAAAAANPKSDNHTSAGQHGSHTGTGTGTHGSALGHGSTATGAGAGAGAGAAYGQNADQDQAGRGTFGTKAPGEPTMGEKISGQKDATMGRATNDPAQYAAGQERKTDTSFGATGGHGSSGAGLGAGAGTGLTGSNTHGTHGSGLTGSNTHGTHGTGLGSNNQGHHTDSNTPGHVGVGDKISGGFDKAIGKATNDPARVQEGEIRKTQGVDVDIPGQGINSGSNTGAYGSGAGAGAGTGTGVGVGNTAGGVGGQQQAYGANTGTGLGNTAGGPGVGGANTGRF